MDPTSYSWTDPAAQSHKGTLNHHAMSIPKVNGDGELVTAAPRPCCTPACDLGEFAVADFDWTFDEFKDGYLPQLPADGSEKKPATSSSSSGPQQAPSTLARLGAGAGRAEYIALQAQLAAAAATRTATNSGSSSGSSSSSSSSNARGGGTSLVVPVAADKKQYLAYPFCITANVGPELPLSYSAVTPEREPRPQKRKLFRDDTEEEEAQQQQKKRRRKFGHTVLC